MQENEKPVEELRLIQINEDIIINGIRIGKGEELPVLIDKKNDNSKNIGEFKVAQIISGMLYVMKRDRESERSKWYKQIVLADKNILDHLRRASQIKASSREADDAHLNIDILTSILVLDDREESYINTVRGIINALHIEIEDEAREDIIEQYENLLLKILEEGIGKYPSSYSLLFHMSDYYNNAENYEFAYKYLNLLKEHHKGKEIDKLEESIKKREKHENDILYIYDLINMNREDEALEKCEEFLKEDPKNWYCLMLKGWALRLKEKWQESFDTSLLSIKNGGDDFAENYNEMALCKFALNEYDEAAYYGEIAFDMQSDSIDYATNLAMINIERGKMDDAFNNLFSACLINKDDEILKMLIQKFEEKTGEKFKYPDEVNEYIKKKNEEREHCNCHKHNEHDNEHCNCHEHEHCDCHNDKKEK